MSTHKVLDRKGVACGCEYTRDARGREEISRMCQAHEAEHMVMAASAAVSATEARNRDLVES